MPTPRRTFAIISHPDAGKTTLTEKLLLYAGAIHQAGSVRARKASRHAVSDWMKMEQERGISVSSSVLQFEYGGSALNLLDTPGHADFSEDTYRVLSAVDSAVMLIDHTKGIEARTLKLFEVCRMRGLPIVTFMNKLDRDGHDPLHLLDEVSKTLDLHVCPMNWPVGSGREFKGVVDIHTREVLLYDGGDHGQERVELKKVPLDGIGAAVGDRLEREVNDQLELLAVAGDVWTKEAFLGGTLTPIFWGSAMTNFGVEPLLDFLSAQAATPMARKATDEAGQEIVVTPDDPTFSGFIFKIQANMNPRHRDRIAFLRVVSGEFKRDMEATVGRSGEVLKLSKPHSFLAQERSIVDDAAPGDIVGLFDPGKLRIGDTLSEGRTLRFGGIPRFAPEHFARVVLKDPMRRKQLDTGLSQLSHEGVIQLFYREEMGKSDPWLGAVGILQFEVLKERLLTEYRVQTVIEKLPYSAARWVGGKPEALAWLAARRDYKVVKDRNDHAVVLAETEWGLQYALRNAPGLELHDIEPM
jgi:peptide chain release factor 3